MNEIIKTILATLESDSLLYDKMMIEAKTEIDEQYYMGKRSAICDAIFSIEYVILQKTGGLKNA